MMADDPIAMFQQLFARAAQACAEPDAMVLASVDPDGRPSARFVLLKACDRRRFTFYTNLDSRKARALAVHPYSALGVYWAPIDQQVRIEGRVERVADEEADAYFETRPRESQLGA
jgi:pyridoxamine 5'-phosphate oxidase